LAAPRKKKTCKINRTFYVLVSNPYISHENDAELQRDYAGIFFIVVPCRVIVLLGGTDFAKMTFFGGVAKKKLTNFGKVPPAKQLDDAACYVKTSNDKLVLRFVTSNSVEFRFFLTVIKHARDCAPICRARAGACVDQRFFPYDFSGPN